MVRSTIIVRASDALPLAASVDDEQVGRHSMNFTWLPLTFAGGLRDGSPLDRASLTRAQATSEGVIQAPDVELRAASLHREWSIHPPVCTATLCSTQICTHQYVSPGSYLIADNVVYLTIADKSYPRKLAFSYLDELSKEFSTSYGAKVETVRKPYAFVGFGWSLRYCV